MDREVCVPWLQRKERLEFNAEEGVTRHTSRRQEKKAPKPDGRQEAE